MTAASVRWLGYGVMVTLLALGSVGLQRDLGCAMARTEAVGSTPTANAPPLPAPGQAKMRLLATRPNSHRPFKVSCFLKANLPGQPVMLLLPEGLEMMPESAAIQFTPPRWRGTVITVTWRLRAMRPGTYRLRAIALDGAETVATIECREFFCCTF